LTGAGDRAFCSGNDLKATGRGGRVDAGLGFGGLCGRFGGKNRHRRRQCVAMGGGLEIVPGRCEWPT